MSNITRRDALALLGGGMTALGLAACKKGANTIGAAGTPRAISNSTVYRIGILQYASHEALNVANKGVLAALDEAGVAYELDQQNAQGDRGACQGLAEQLANDGNDLIIAIATPAVEACAAATSDIPIVGTCVTSYGAAGVVDSDDAPGRNVTGSSDLSPVNIQIRILRTVLPKINEVAVLYTDTEANSAVLAEAVSEACAEYGINATGQVISSAEEIQPVVSSLAGTGRALYVPTDNLLATNASTIGAAAKLAKLPVIAGEEGIYYGTEALYTYCVNYDLVGRRAGKMGGSILLDGKTPSNMPIQYCDGDERYIKINWDKSWELEIKEETWDTISFD